MAADAAAAKQAVHPSWAAQAAKDGM